MPRKAKPAGQRRVLKQTAIPVGDAVGRGPSRRTRHGAANGPRIPGVSRVIGVEVHDARLLGPVGGAFPRENWFGPRIGSTRCPMLLAVAREEMRTEALEEAYWDGQGDWLVGW